MTPVALDERPDNHVAVSYQPALKYGVLTTHFSYSLEKITVKLYGGIDLHLLLPTYGLGSGLAFCLLSKKKDLTSVEHTYYC